MKTKLPVPANELGRLYHLAEFDLDYSNLDANFKDLTRLTAKVAGTDISLVNIIDSYTQWTISSHGLLLEQMPREDSACQYTIADEEPFTIPDMSADERFHDKFYVNGELALRYYFGVPLKTGSGFNIGALCVLDKESKLLSPEKIEMLEIIAAEIVNRLKALKAIEDLKRKLHEANEVKKRVAHDIRGPLAGIIGLAQIIDEQGEENTLDEVLEFVSLIHKSSNSLLDLANEILSADFKSSPAPARLGADELNQNVLKEKLEKLFLPQAKYKNIRFTVSTNSATENVPFSKQKLLQIIGNLVSNAIKFTPQGGKVAIDLDLKLDVLENILLITVTDSGIGMDEEAIAAVLTGKGVSTTGTTGELGFGFGLALVKNLVEGLNGMLAISSIPGEGTKFEISLPQYKI